MQVFDVRLQVMHVARMLTLLSRMARSLQAFALQAFVSEDHALVLGVVVVMRATRATCARAASQRNGKL